MNPAQNIQVAVRLRPVLAHETETEYKISQDKVLKLSHDGRSLSVANKFSYAFDEIFTPETDQQDIFDQVVEPLISSSLEGYNVTILAYGQTGTGKTHTMGTNSASINDQQRGIIPRIFEYLFSRLQHSEISHEIYMTFVEVYNEELRDLLSTESRSNRPSIRQDKHGKVTVTGCECMCVTDMNEAYSILQSGIETRSTGETLMNPSSSRSHAVLTLNCTFQVKSDDAAFNSPKLTSKIHLVDLAGSERLKRTGASGQRLVESVGINQGLFVLGKVLNALSAVNSPSSLDDRFIPYRESKLTRLLQDSLGGNARVLLLACLSSSRLNLHESLETIKYASWARRIKQRAVINRVIDDGDDRRRCEEQQLREDEFKEILTRERLECSHVMSEMKMKHDEEMKILMRRIDELEDLRRFAGKVQNFISSSSSSSAEGTRSIDRSNDDEQVVQMREKMHEYEEELRRDEVIFASKVVELKQLNFELTTLKQEMTKTKKELADERRMRKQAEVLNKELLIEIRG